MKKTTLVIGAASAALMMAAAVAANAQSWADNTTVSGRMYYDYTNLNTKVNGVKAGANNGNGFDITRFYTSVDHKFTDIFSGDVTTDIQYTGSTSTAIETYIKKAYLDANFDPMFDVKAGATDMPWIPYAESIYGDRFVEKTIVDREKFGTSSDWGLHAAGSWGKPSDVQLSYQVSMVNGNGYKNPTRSKTMDFETRVSAIVDYQWNFALGTYNGKLGQDTFGAAVLPKQKAERFDALAAWVGDHGRVGVEAFSAKNDTAAQILSAVSEKESGTSVFGTYRFNHDWSAFANSQNTKPSNIVAVGKVKSDDYYNVGVTYSAFKNVDFSLVLKHDDNKAYKAIAPTATFNETVSNEVGIFAQFRY